MRAFVRERATGERRPLPRGKSSLGGGFSGRADSGRRIVAPFAIVRDCSRDRPADPRAPRIWIFPGKRVADAQYCATPRVHGVFLLSFLCMEVDAISCNFQEAFINGVT